MTDLGHGKDLKFVKTIDPATPMEYSGAASVSSDNQLATVKYVDDHPGASAAVHDKLTISTPGQTAFTLSSTPVNPDRSILTLNGQVKIYGGGVGEDYTISGTTLTWNDDGGVTLVEADDFQIWYNVTLGGGPLAQEQLYLVAKAGNDGNDGKSDEAPFESVPAAITAVLGESPVVGDQFAIEIIDDAQYTVDFTLPPFVKLYAPKAVLKSNIIVNDNTEITCKRLIEPSTGAPPTLITKSSGTGTAVINVLELFEVGDGRGVNCSAGKVIVNTSHATSEAGYILGDGSGEVVFNVNKATGIDTGYIVFANGNGNYHFNYNHISSTSSNAVFGSGASGGVINANGGYIDATGGGRLYQFTVPNQFTFTGTGYDETNASTNSGSSTLNLIINRDKDDKTKITNSITDIDITSTTADVNLIATANNVIASAPAGEIQLDSQDGTRLSIGDVDIFRTSGGYATFLSHPLFSASVGTPIADVTGDGTAYPIVFGDESFDRGGHYNQGTGQFVSPVTGKYPFTATVDLSSIGGSHTDCEVYFFTTGGSYHIFTGNPSNCANGSGETPPQQLIVNGYCLADMNATDTCSVVATVSNGTKTVAVGIKCRFAGFLFSL